MRKEKASKKDTGKVGNSKVAIEGIYSAGIGLLKPLWLKLREGVTTANAPFLSSPVNISPLSNNSTHTHSIHSQNAHSTHSQNTHTGGTIKSFFLKLLTENSEIPKLPKSKSKKPTVLFNIDHLLGRYKFSLTKFDVPFHKRALCDEFLFHLGTNYELVGISNVYFPLGKEAFELIDPFGCISYKIVTKDSRRITPEVINRPLNKLLVIGRSKNEFSGELRRNVLEVPEYSSHSLCKKVNMETDGKKTKTSRENNANEKTGTREETGLFKLLHFCNNLHYSNVQDFRRTIESYQGKNFYEEFQKIQKRLFEQRNLLNFAAFEEKLGEVNENKIRQFREAEKEMRKMKGGQGVGLERVGALLKGFILNRFL